MSGCVPQPWPQNLSAEIQENRMATTSCPPARTTCRTRFTCGSATGAPRRKRRPARTLVGSFARPIHRHAELADELRSIVGYAASGS